VYFVESTDVFIDNEITAAHLKVQFLLHCHLVCFSDLLFLFQQQKLTVRAVRFIFMSQSSKQYNCNINRG
jgi:hypothetical protein